MLFMMVVSLYMSRVILNAFLKKQSDKRDSYSTKVQKMNFDLSLEAAKLRNFYISGSLKI